MKIIKNTNFKTHNTSVRTAGIKYIVMHYTASDGGTAANHINYFNNPSTTQASADFFVDEKGIYQYNTQLDSRYSWAVGDGSGGTFGNKCWNGNQISIEMCCYQKGGKWYINDDTYRNAVELVKYLMSKYNISVNNVIRHYDVSRKLCPNAVGWLSSTGSEATWNKFKSAVSGKSETNTAPSSPQQTNTTSSTIYRVRKNASDVTTQIGAFKNLSSAKALADKNTGYSVCDSNGKVVYTPKTSFNSYTVKITADVLNVRKGAGTNYGIATTVKKNEVYTIVDEGKGEGSSKGWGLLKSFKNNRNGWISLDYVKKQ